MELIDGVIHLLNHYKSCTCCCSGDLAGILAPSLIARLSTSLTKENKDYNDNVSLISVSTTSGIVDNSSSEISTNPFSGLPSKDLKDELYSLCITNGSSIEKNNEPELILSSRQSETRLNSLPSKSSTVLVTKQTASPVGRKALRNAVINKSLTCPDKPVYYRSSPSSWSSDTSAACNKEAVYTHATTSDINRGRLWKKLVELQGRVTRCYTVPSDNTQHHMRIKLLNFTDSQGSTQVTLKGDLSAEYEKMVKAATISVKGVCERKIRKPNSMTSQYEVIAQSWCDLPDKTDKEKGENKEEHKREKKEAPATRFGAHDIRYPQSEPRINVTVQEERCRTVQATNKGGTQIVSVTRTFNRRPPPLVPVDNRTVVTAQYAPTVYLSQFHCYKNKGNIVTWGRLSNATVSSATLTQGGAQVKLYFSDNYRTDSNLVMVEGSPFHDNVNSESIAVVHIDDLYYKHVPCLKFLASYGANEPQTRTGKKMDDFPKIVKGGDLRRYRGKFVVMRGKLIQLQFGPKKSRRKGRVICGDGLTVNFNMVSFSNKYRNIALDDQIALIGKVDYGYKRTPASDIPWLTVEHLQVIPDKETDTVLGFNKVAIYEALKLLETLKSEDSSLDPWSFLND